MSGAIPPLPNTPSWRGAQLKKRHRENLTFTFTVGILLELILPTCFNFFCFLYIVICEICSYVISSSFLLRSERVYLVVFTKQMLRLLLSVFSYLVRLLHFVGTLLTYLKSGMKEKLL